MRPEHLAATYAAAFPDQRPWTAEEFTALLAHPSGFVVGRQDSFALGRYVVDEAELLTIATLPSHQRKGLGRAALSAFEDEAAMRGANTIFLEVATDNAPALALYKKAGYLQSGVRKAYYARPNRAAVDALLFAKTLTPNI